MSLYDGLDIDSKEGKKDNKPDVSGWGSHSKLLETQKHIQAKKASTLNLKKRQNTTVAPVFDLKRRSDDSPLTFNMQTGKMERMQGSIPSPVSSSGPGPVSGSSAPPPAIPFLGSEAPSTFLGVTDEYDPLRPNDYETYAKRRKEQKMKEREEERRKEMEDRERRRHERHRDDRDDDEDRRHRRRHRHDDSDEEDHDRHGRDRDRDRERERDRDRDRDRDRERGDRPRGGAAIAPPKSLLEEEPEQKETNDKEKGPPNSSGEYGGSFNVGKGSVISRMMAKMGYREGQGLGKSEQGMSTALQVEKTSKRGGKIIHERDIPKEAPKPEPGPSSNVNLLRNPSKVLLLRNMVGPGEVDEELEPETAEECQKYGKVLKCVIFEIPGAVPEEAVRIFVEFERQESAIKAVVDLNGRFFGGRSVKASFYNLDRFRRLDLADPVE